MRFCEAETCTQPVFGTCKKSRKGYCKRHQYLRLDYDKRSIAQKAVAKRQQQIEVDIRGLHPKDNSKIEAMMNSKDELWKWFTDRRKEMTGVCQNCGGRTSKNDEDKFHYSLAHLLPKAFFPSVATHPDNWLELCYYGKSCHTNMDNKILDLIDMHCFDQIITKFVKIYPSIAKEERRRIPQILLQYLETEI